MGAGAPVVGGILTGEAIDEESRATAAALRADAATQRKNAEISRESGVFNAASQQREVVQLRGAQSADVAASGTTQDSGSAIDILRQTNTNAELDRLNILHGAELEAIGAENQSSSLLRQAKATEKIGELKKYAAYAGAAGEAYKRSK